MYLLINWCVVLNLCCFVWYFVFGVFGFVWELVMFVFFLVLVCVDVFL